MSERDTIENRTFDEISLGDEATLTRTLSRDDVDLFAVVSGDINPVHVDAEFAAEAGWDRVSGHSMWAGALISALLGTELPGPGTRYVSQSLRFFRPIELGDTLTVRVTVAAKNETERGITLDCACCNQRSEEVAAGQAHVTAPVLATHGIRPSKQRVAEIPNRRMGSSTFMSQRT